MRTSYLATIALAAILVACDRLAFDGVKTKPVCDTAKKHCIYVYVSNSMLSVNYPFLDLRGKGPDHQIYWQFDETTAAGYVFPNDGITFPSASSSEINCQLEDHGKRFRCDDKNQTPGHDTCDVYNNICYKYTIKATPPQGSINPLDPWVVND